MIKITLLVVLCLGAVLMLPQTGAAEKTALKDEELKDVVGQSGIVKERTTKFDTHYDTLPVMNGLLSLTDVDIKGSITTRTPFDDQTPVTQTSDLDLPGGLEVKGLQTILDYLGSGSGDIDATINIDELSIGAMRAGSSGVGSTFGSVSVDNMRIDLVGSAPVTQRP